LIKVSKFLDWELIEESHEEADGDVTLWSPKYGINSNYL